MIEKFSFALHVWQKIKQKINTPLSPYENRYYRDQKTLHEPCQELPKEQEISHSTPMWGTFCIYEAKSAVRMMNQAKAAYSNLKNIKAEL